MQIAIDFLSNLNEIMNLIISFIGSGMMLLKLLKQE